MDAYTSPSTRPLYRGTQLVWYLLGLVEVLLAFRFVMKLLGANPAAPFTNFIYGVTQVLVNPFVSVFRVVYTRTNVFEWTTLLAMVVYWIIAWGIIKLLIIGKPVSTPEAAEKLDNQR